MNPLLQALINIARREQSGPYGNCRVRFGQAVTGSWSASPQTCNSSRTCSAHRRTRPPSMRQFERHVSSAQEGERGKVLESRGMIPGSKCTLLFVGEADEITKAFRDDAASGHAGAQYAVNAMEGELQPAIFVGSDRCYVGDRFEHDEDSTAIRIPGPGFVLQRFYDEAAASLDCKCLQSGGGSCKIVLLGPVATCETGTCSDCGWSTRIPTVVVPLKVLAPEFEEI